MFAFTACGLFRTPLEPAFGGSAYGLGRYSTVLTMSGRAFCASMRPLAVYIYSFGSQSCTARLGLNRSAPLAYPPSEASRRRRCASRGAAKQAAHVTLFVFGGTTFVFHRARRPATARSRLASRALHPPSAARYVVGGIPPSLSRLHLSVQLANRPRGSRSCSPPPPRSRLHLGSGAFFFVSFARRRLWPTPLSGCQAL